MIALFLGSALQAVAPVPEPVSFGSWVAACDNVRHCEALALPPEDGSHSEWTLYVSREAGRSAVPKVSASPAFGQWEGESRPVRLMIDGRRTQLGFDADGEAVGDAMDLLGAIAAARTVIVLDLNGTNLGVLPVGGASAALRWIDDRQRRAGTVSAIVAKGTAAASNIPPAPSLPRIIQPPISSMPPTRLNEEQIKLVLQETEFCDQEPFEEVSHFRLDARNTAAIIPCMRHAYQSSHMVVVVDEAGKWRPAPIEQPQPPHEYLEEHDAYRLVEGHYEQERRLLWMAAKGRGLADCGSSAAWAWDGQMFRLASYHALDECRGAPPGTWFSRWQTANAPLDSE